MEIGNHKEGVCKIACVVVTYNRKTLLERCLNAIKEQTYKPSAVYVIDNASTDGTDTFLHASGYVNRKMDGILFKYYRLEKNEGGAGGFYKGMKTAHEDADYDGFWVMDDDGEPDKDCLKELVPYLKERDYIAPLVVAVEDHDCCAFVPDTTVKEFQQKASNGIFENWSSPFNGILYSRKLINKIGYPNKEMFIWGDEMNYHYRAIQAGMPPMTVVNALHYHPKAKDVMVTSCKGTRIVFVNQYWRGYCHYRNFIYNRRFQNYTWKQNLRYGIGYLKIHLYYFIFKIHSAKWTWCFLKAFFAGVFGKFGGQYSYMKK